MSVTRVAGSRDGRYRAVEAPGLVVEPGRIEDDDAVWRGRQEPGEPELAERARHDSRTDPIASASSGWETWATRRSWGRCGAEARSSRCEATRCFTVPNALIAVCCRGVVQACGSAPRPERRPPARSTSAGAWRLNRLDAARVRAPRSSGPPTTSGIPRTSPLHAYANGDLPALRRGQIDADQAGDDERCARGIALSVEGRAGGIVDEVAVGRHAFNDVGGKRGQEAAVGGRRRRRGVPRLNPILRGRAAVRG
jgi:hypothetical protein